VNKKFIITATILIVTGVMFIGNIIYDNQQAEKRGKEKFYQAISEIMSENPELDNPCLGTHVIRWNSYAELDKKSVDEIKQIAKQAPRDC
jgi:hypothetical protein